MKIFFVFVFVLFSIAVLSPNIELECDEYAAAADKCEWELHQIGKCRGTISLVALIKTSMWGSDEIRRRWFREKEAEHSFCKNRKQNHRGQGFTFSLSFVGRTNYGFLSVVTADFYMRLNRGDSLPILSLLCVFSKLGLWTFLKIGAGKWLKWF